MPIAETHFPDRLHQFVWRNWELANTARIAEVAGCRAADILAVGRSMGLPSKPNLTADQLRRIYITVIRQNWHLLPHEQIIQLLGWTRERYEFTLKEDDFLNVKPGSKPDCEKIVYCRPGHDAKRRTAEIRRTLKASLGKQLAAGEPPFRFIDRLSDANFSMLRDRSAAAPAGCVDVSGWPVTVEGADSHLLDRFSTYLRDAMASDATGPGRFAFHLQPGITGGSEDFTVEVGDALVRVTANAPSGLLQAGFWMEDRMEEYSGPFLPRGTVARRAVLDPRYIYPYFSLYGDPLLEPEADPLPDGYLEKLARAGITGVWLQCVLRNMARTPIFPEFGALFSAAARTRCAPRFPKSGINSKALSVNIGSYSNRPGGRPMAMRVIVNCENTIGITQKSAWFLGRILTIQAGFIWPSVRSSASGSPARFPDFSSSRSRSILGRGEPPLEAFGAVNPFREQVIALGQRMTGVGVERARQRFRHDMRNPVLHQPERDAIAECPIHSTIFTAQHVLVERTEEYQHIVVTLAQGRKDALEGVPLE